MGTYPSISANATPFPKTGIVNTVAIKGLNNLTFSQLLDSDYAQTINNYIVKGEGVLEKRKWIEKLLEVSTINYDAQSGNFTTGLTLTGGTSGATGLILLDSDSGTTGTLTLANITGTFEDNETITDTSTGSATSNGVIADGTEAITMAEKFTNDIIIFGFSTCVCAYNITAWTIELIKADFSANSGFVWEKYGDYFFIANGVDKIYRISRILNYDNQTANFTVSTPTDTNVLTGGTSEATAVILEDSDSGSAWYITLGEVSGTFEDNETITWDIGSGSADVNGIIDWQINEITDSPICLVLYQFNSRLFAGNIKGDISRIMWAEQDAGNNPPFTNWTTSATPPEKDDPSSLRFRNGGEIKSISSLGGQIIGLLDDGKMGFRIEVVDVGSVGLTQKPVIDFQEIDFVGEKGAVSTQYWVFYVNESGIWNMVSGGNTSQPYSQNEANISKVLGATFLENLTLTDADIIYDNNQDLILITCKEESTKNNIVIWFDPELKAFGKFDNLHINRFFKINNQLYGTGSRKTKIWKMFEWNSDDNTSIAAKYEQEINLGSINHLYALERTFINSEISETTALTISFDIYNRKGQLVDRKKTYTVSTDETVGDFEGFGEFGWGDAFGWPEIVGNGLINTYAAKRTRIHEFYRLVFRIEEDSEQPHKINWFSLTAIDKWINPITHNIT